MTDGYMVVTGQSACDGSYDLVSGPHGTFGEADEARRELQSHYPPQIPYVKGTPLTPVYSVQPVGWAALGPMRRDLRAV